MLPFMRVALATVSLHSNRITIKRGTKNFLKTSLVQQLYAIGGIIYLLDVNMHHVRGQLEEASSLFLLCGFQGSNLGDQTWQQAPLCAEPSHGPWVRCCYSFHYTDEKTEEIK